VESGLESDRKIPALIAPANEHLAQRGGLQAYVIPTNNFPMCLNEVIHFSCFLYSTEGKQEFISLTDFHNLAADHSCPSCCGTQLGLHITISENSLVRCFLVDTPLMCE
jgi:hypothetical protein